MVRLLIASGVLAFVVGPARAQTCARWTQTASGEPFARDRLSTATDSLRQRVVLHGGGNLGTVYADTWEYIGGSWQPRASTGPGVVGVPMAFDEARGVSVLLGGALTSEPTFEWNGENWTMRNIPGPVVGFDTSMAYDAARQTVVLFNGSTWTYNGAWAMVAATGPAPRFASAMVYDRRRQRVVLFGGHDSAPLGDTWEWDGARWELRATSGPSPRHYHAMCYDERQQRVVLHGGSSGSGETWIWNGAAWRRLQVSAPARGGHAMAFDPQSGRPIMFGGCCYFAQTYSLRWCVADFNDDGCADPDDLADYIGCYFEPGGCLHADFNGDGTTDPDDLSDYIAAFFSAC